MIILGDVNINMLDKNNAQVKCFQDILNDYGLTCMNKKPTRITKSSSTLIDMILANNISLPYILTQYTHCALELLTMNY